MSGERLSMPIENAEKQNDAPWVLLRGLARESRHWGDFPAQLSEALGVEVLCPDTPGNGQLNTETSPLTISATLERVREWVREEIGNRAPINLLGLSMGGMIATEWARLHPQEVRALVLVNSSFGNFSPPWKRLWPSAFISLMGSLTQPAEQREAQVFDLICQRSEDRQERIGEWAGYAMEKPLTTSNFMRQLAAAARFRAPAKAPVTNTLVINGLGDRLVNPDCSAAIARRWGVELRSHPSAGHDLTHDAGQWVTETLGEWIVR